MLSSFKLSECKVFRNSISSSDKLAAGWAQSDCRSFVNSLSEAMKTLSLALPSLVNPSLFKIDHHYQVKEYDKSFEFNQTIHGISQETAILLSQSC